MRTQTNWLERVMHCRWAIAICVAGVFSGLIALEANGDVRPVHVEVTQRIDRDLLTYQRGALTDYLSGNRKQWLAAYHLRERGGIVTNTEDLFLRIGPTASGVMLAAEPLFVPRAGTPGSGALRGPRVFLGARLKFGPLEMNVFDPDFGRWVAHFARSISRHDDLTQESLPPGTMLEFLSPGFEPDSRSVLEHGLSAFRRFLDQLTHPDFYESIARLGGRQALAAAHPPGVRPRSVRVDEVTKAVRTAWQQTWTDPGLVSIEGDVHPLLVRVRQGETLPNSALAHQDHQDRVQIDLANAHLGWPSEAPGLIQKTIAAAIDGAMSRHDQVPNQLGLVITMPGTLRADAPMLIDLTNAAVKASLGDAAQKWMKAAEDGQQSHPRVRLPLAY